MKYQLCSIQQTVESVVSTEIEEMHFSVSVAMSLRHHTGLKRACVFSIIAHGTVMCQVQESDLVY